MSYKPQISSLRNFSSTASTIAISAALISCAAVFSITGAYAAEKLPSVELHLDVLDGAPVETKSKKGDPFAPENSRNAEPKAVDSLPVTGKMPFSTTPSEPLKASELPKKKQKKPAKKIEQKTEAKKAAAPEKVEKILPAPPKQAIEKPEAPVQQPAAPKEQEPEFFIPPTTNEKPISSEPPIIPAPPVAAPKIEPIVPTSPPTKEPETIKSPEVKLEPVLPVPPAVPARESKPEVSGIGQEPAIIPIPTPSTEETKLPKLSEKKPEPVIKEPVIIQPPAPQKTEAPAPNVPEVDKKSSSVAITPMPPAPTPNEEFLKAIATPSENVEKTKEAEKPDVTGAKEIQPQKPNEGTAAPDPNFLLSIKFLNTEATLPISAEEDLKKIAKNMKSNKQTVTLFSYASESADQATTARRVSMARALAVRAFLIEQGIDSFNINVRAEGSKGVGGEPDRVDIVLLKDEKTK